MTKPWTYRVVFSLCCNHSFVSLVYVCLCLFTLSPIFSNIWQGLPCSRYWGYKAQKDIIFIPQCLPAWLTDRGWALRAICLEMVTLPGPHQTLSPGTILSYFNILELNSTFYGPSWTLKLLFWIFSPPHKDFYCHLLSPDNVFCDRNPHLNITCVWNLLVWAHGTLLGCIPQGPIRHGLNYFWLPLHL